MRARKPNPTCLGAALHLAFATVLPLPGQEVRAIPFVHEPPAVDGRPDAAEWRSALRLGLDRREQVWREAERGAWGGLEDLSGFVLLAYDAAHLYLGGEVRDNSLVAQKPDAKWEDADAIELFLNLDLADDLPGPDGQPRSTAFNEDDVQLFFMPFNEQRPWGQIGWDPKLQRPAIRSGFALTGVRVAFQSLGPNRYSFEARLPFHNFYPPDREVPGRIGFGLALDDHDEGSARYQYMTLDGRNPVGDTRNLLALEFANGPPLPRDARAEPTLWTRAGRWLGEFAVPLLAVLLLAVLFRGWHSVSERRRGVRLAGSSVAALAFAIGLVLPGAALRMRERQAEQTVAGVLDALQAGIPEMERGTLASYAGAQREEQLLELLRGRGIQRRQYYDYTFLADLAADEFGPAPRRYPGEFWNVRPYWIALPPGQVERFDFPTPLVGRRLLIVLAVPPPVFATDLDEGPPRVRLALRGEGPAATEQVRELLFDGLRTPGGSFGSHGRELIYELVELEEPVAGLNLQLRAGLDVELVGLTLIEEERAQGRPLHLGRASLGGIPTPLRGPHPEPAGIELAAGERRVPLPDTGAAYDKVWVFYRADHPGELPEGLVAGTPVGEIAVQFRGGKAPPRQVPLQHQRNVLFELSRNNQVKGPPPGSNAAVAYEWKDASGEQHINLVSEIELPPGEVVEAITFKAAGHYPIGFRAVVFGRARDAAPADSSASPLTRTDPRTVALREDFARRLAGVEFALYRDGALAGTSSERAAAGPLPADFAGAIAPRMRAVHDGDRRVQQGCLALAGPGWTGSVLVVTAADPGFGAFARLAHAAGLGFCLLAAPVLLLLLAEALASFSSLRLRLLAALSVATLAPLGVLAWMVLRVVEQGHDAQQRQQIGSALVAARGQLDALQSELAHSAETWVKALAEDLQSTLPTAVDDGPRVRLLARMASQRPPEWKGGFLRLELTPSPRAIELPPLTLFEGEPALRGDDTPMRLEPSIYVVWGVPVLGVRRELEAEIGTVSLSVARPLDAAMLAKLAPQHVVVLCDVQGYPLAVAGGAVGQGDDASWQSFEPSMMAARREIVAQAKPDGEPAVRRHDVAGRVTLGAYTVLRDLESTPRALLGIGKAAESASLVLPTGRMPVRAFLSVVAGVLLLFAVALSSVVTARIIRPIERLERGAQALGRGDLDVKVDSVEGDGQIARLTRSFNEMAQDLRGRIGDLRILNQGMQELSSRLELRDAMATIVALFLRNSPADRVRVLVREREAATAVVHGDEPVTIDATPPALAALLDSVGPFSMRLGTDPALASLAAAVGGRAQTALGLPLVLGGRPRGCVLLLFEAQRPPAVNLELLSTLAVQAALAVENGRLYRSAVEDPYTGAYVAEFFRRRVVVTIGAAQTSGARVGLLAVQLADGDRLREVFGAERLERCVELAAGALQRAVQTRAGTSLGRWSSHELRVLVSDCTADAAEALRRAVAGAAAGIDFGLPPEWQPVRIATAAASFPEDAASAEFLFGVLEQRLAATRNTGVPLPAITTEGDLVATSPAMQTVLRTLQRVAPTDIPVLIEGETGTGKELLADLAHHWSRRARGPLVKVHCAALPESLLQSELFGHERGAFTGAEARKLGKFELARGGTILLDEIGEISMDVQVKLLRVLQQKEIDRVGGLHPVAVDVRVVTATNRNLRELVARGAFREDLYYRLQGVTIAVPPLRERREEIPLLIERFCAEVRASGQSQVRGFATDALDVLYRHDWPGNVRELRNAVVRAAVLTSGEWVERAHLAGILGPGIVPETPAETSPPGPQAAAGVAPTSPTDPDGPDAARHVPADAVAGAPGVDRHRRILDLLQERGTVAVADCVEACGVSPRTALRLLTELMLSGAVERVGIRRGARYRMANKTVET